MRKTAAVAVFLITCAFPAQAQQPTLVEWGLLPGAEPRSVCVYDYSPSPICVPIGTLNSGTHVFAPLISSGSVTSSMLAPGAAAANLSTMLPGLSASVLGTGTPGLDGSKWFINGPTSDFGVQQATFRVDRRDTTGTGGAVGNSNAIWAYNLTNPSNARSEWTISGEMHNTSNVATAGQVAVTGTVFKEISTVTSATTGASGTGATATVTFTPAANTVATIPVGHTVQIAGMTPSGYNGNFVVTASSSGSVSFASATTGAQTVAGAVVDISYSPSWGLVGNCVDQSGENNPWKSCLGAELDVTLQPTTAIATTDTGKNRVGLQVQLNGNANASGSHAGRAMLIGAASGLTWDRGADFQGAFGIGLDFTGATFTAQPIMLADNQGIALDAITAGTFNRKIWHSSSGFTYTTSNGNEFFIDDTGNVKLSNTGHFVGTTALPTISTCGTSPPAASAGSHSNGGQFTLGTGATAACTVTFATAFPTQAYCIVTPASNYTGTYYISAQSKTAFTVTLGTGTASVVFNYACNGN
jgi:hypothetical protein